MSLITTLSIAMGSAWCSGLNLYAAVLTLGILGATGSVALPGELEHLATCPTRW